MFCGRANVRPLFLFAAIARQKRQSLVARHVARGGLDAARTFLDDELVCGLRKTPDEEREDQ
jgi:hypothetical protein